jgi:hypothetical protein
MKGATFYFTMEIVEKDGTVKTERYRIDDPLIYYAIETELIEEYVDHVQKVGT